MTKGVLQVRRGAGTYVSSLTPAEDDPLRLNAKLHDRFKLALDLFDVRLILEPEIAAKAAVYATDEDIATLKQLCKETEELYLADKDHMPKDIEFHTWIARCSKESGHGIPDPDHQFGNQYLREPDEALTADRDDHDPPGHHGSHRKS